MLSQGKNKLAMLFCLNEKLLDLFKASYDYIYYLFNVFSEQIGIFRESLIFQDELALFFI